MVLEVRLGEAKFALNENEESVGYTLSTLIPFGPYAGEWGFMLQVYSNQPYESIHFQFYDNETNTIYFITENMEFIPDGVIGNAMNPFVFSISNNIPPPSCIDNNEDGFVDEFPTISIIDGEAQVLIQESLNNYIDSGATCSDQEDGDISQHVEVSGDVVNMNNPGTYIVSYNCSDSDENAAQTKHRTVFIVGAPIVDENEDGHDDTSYNAGAQSGDTNLDGELNIQDVVLFINRILDGE